MDGESHVWSLPLYAFYRFKEYVKCKLKFGKVNFTERK